MTLELEQEESIRILKEIEVIPMDNKINVKFINNEKLITRAYRINSSDTYPKMKWVVVSYKVSRYADKVKDYAIYLTDETDKVYLCKYSPEVINTLFNNIILLEMSNWRRIVNGLKPLKNINNYQSFKFEVGNDKKLIHLLQKIIEKNTSALLTKFEKYKNTNEAIPAEIWHNQIC